MKETKPTAKAATTVVSTPPLTGRTPPARRRGGARRRGRAPGPAAAGLALASGALRRPRRQRRAVSTTSASRAERDERPARARRRSRSRRRRARPARAGRTRRTSSALICAFVLPCAISSAMNVALLVCHLRTSETFSAVPHSRHMTSSSMSGSEARGAAARRRRRGEQRERRAARRGRAHHAFSSSSGGSVCVEPLLRHGQPPHGGDAPVAVDARRSPGSPSGPTCARSAVAVAQVGVGEPELVDRLERGAGVLLHVDARARCRPACRERLVRLLDQRQLIDGTAGTTRPRR